MPDEPARYTCYRAAGPITVDGRLDEPSWRAVPFSTPFVDIVTGEPAWFDTRVALLWDVTRARQDTRPAAQALSGQELERLWADLAENDPARAQAALWKLAAAPAQAVPLLRDRLRPAVACQPLPRALTALCRPATVPAAARPRLLVVVTPPAVRVRTSWVAVTCTRACWLVAVSLLRTRSTTAGLVRTYTRSRW